jgi:hypothetical protein
LVETTSPVEAVLRQEVHTSQPEVETISRSEPAVVEPSLRVVGGSWEWVLAELSPERAVVEPSLEVVGSSPVQVAEETSRGEVESSPVLEVEGISPEEVES